ncbi:MAG: hypothetical protein MRY63_05985 [Neomegalonema sp.]|nr:hypothetical protein [Neomegalonema sp.]
MTELKNAWITNPWVGSAAVVTDSPFNDADDFSNGFYPPENEAKTRCPYDYSWQPEVKPVPQYNKR